MNDRLSLALDAIDAFIGSNADDSQRLVAAKCAGLMRGYHARWEHAGYTALAVETVLQAPLTNPDTNRASRTFSIAGKLDVIARFNGRRILVDHKTTSHDIADPDSPYWRQLVIEGQVNHYYLLAWMNGERFDNAVWDVTKKPGISPKKLSKAERASVVAEGKYFGQPIDASYRQALSLGEERESLQMYSFRLAHDCTVERPEWYFQRRPVPRIDAELLEYARELWAHGQEIIHARQEDRHPRNSGACILYGGACKFLGVCSGHDRIDSERWQAKPSVHRELEGSPVAIDKAALTNSRIRCFQTCRRKHQFEYELAVERIDEEEKESLFFGSCFHAGLNAWWSTFLEDINVNGNASPENDFGTAANSAGQTALIG